TENERRLIGLLFRLVGRSLTTDEASTLALLATTLADRVQRGQPLPDIRSMIHDVRGGRHIMDITWVYCHVSIPVKKPMKTEDANEKHEPDSEENLDKESELQPASPLIYFLIGGVDQLVSDSELTDFLLSMGAVEWMQRLPYSFSVYVGFAGMPNSDMLGRIHKLQTQPEANQPAKKPRLSPQIDRQLEKNEEKSRLISFVGWDSTGTSLLFELFLSTTPRGRTTLRPI
ncbi:hypothetical protein PFISCL1PPCAC_17374, partial [Pristionchus fissidentatus]